MRALALCLSLFALPVMAAPWQLVTDRSSIEVDVGWVRNTVLTIRFPQLSGDVVFDETDLSDASANITVPTAPLDTGLGFLNVLVRSSEFLDVGTHPQITFALTSITQTSKSTADIAGDITLLGVTLPITFAADVFRFSRAGDGRFEAGFDLEGELDRREFGNSTGYPDIAAELPIRIRLFLKEM
ncbi:MAG: YceI family protein [Pseudomonadota bacterium]